MDFADGFVSQVIKQVDFTYVSFYLLDGNIVILTYRAADTDISLDDVRNHTTLLEGLNSGKPCKIIVDLREFKQSFSADALDYLSTNPRHQKIVRAQAIVVSSLAHKMVSNFYIKVNKPKMPAALFQNLNEAYAWVKEVIPVQV